MVEKSVPFCPGCVLTLCVAAPSGLTCLVHCFMLIPCVFLSHSCSCVWNSSGTIYLLWLSILHIPLHLSFFVLSLCPPSTHSFFYQMLILALHPCSNLQAPPSLTLVPPRTKPKVSSAAVKQIERATGNHDLIVFTNHLPLTWFLLHLHHCFVLAGLHRARSLVYTVLQWCKVQRHVLICMTRRKIR